MRAGTHLPALCGLCQGSWLGQRLQVGWTCVITQTQPGSPDRLSPQDPLLPAPPTHTAGWALTVQAGRSGGPSAFVRGGAEHNQLLR